MTLKQKEVRRKEQALIGAETWSEPGILVLAAINALMSVTAPAAMLRSFGIGPPLDFKDSGLCIESH